MKLSLLLAAPAMVLGTGNAAIDKIVEMLQEMESRGKKEKQEESVAYSAFKTWCDNTQAETATDIKGDQEAIKQAQARIEKAQADAADAQAAVDSAVKNQLDATNNVKAAVKVRAAEAAAHAAAKTELSDSIYASEHAMTALKAVPEKVEAVSSFLQQKLSSKSSRFSAVQSLLETVQQAENPFTSASERKSNVVIDLLEKLKQEFETELQTKTRDEADKKHAHDLFVQDETLTIKNEKKLQTDNEIAKADALAEEGKGKKDHATSQQNLKDNKKYLGEVNVDCSLKAKDFAGRQKSRSEELKAIGEAITIMTSEEVQNGRGHLNNAQSVGAFLQLRSSNDAQEKALNYLRSRAASLHSQTLMQLAEVAGADPFVKIRKMIQELVVRLEEEAKAELTKKGACDKDMAENKANLEEFTTLVEKLTAQVQRLTSEVATNKKEKKQLETGISELNKAKTAAQKMRTDEKTENEKVIRESDAALDAIDNAMGVLQDYYSKVGSSLLQTKAKKPEFSAGEYQGLGGGGVLELLEVVKSQTAQLIRETKSAESDAATSHSDFITETDASLASKTQSLRTTEVTLAQNQEDLDDKKQALDSPEGARVQLQNYQEQKVVIDSRCTVQGVSFEERNSKRQEEIQSLQEALEILGQMAA